MPLPGSLWNGKKHCNYWRSWLRNSAVLLLSSDLGFDVIFYDVRFCLTKVIPKLEKRTHKNCLYTSPFTRFTFQVDPFKRYLLFRSFQEGPLTQCHNLCHCDLSTSHSVTSCDEGFRTCLMSSLCLGNSRPFYNGLGRLERHTQRLEHCKW